MRLVDTHTHLNDEAFSNDLDEVVSRAEAAGVTRLVVCGYDIESSISAVKMTRQFDCVRATVGVHPHDSKTFGPAAEQHIEELSQDPKVIAIGEIGLDFHYDHSPRPDQYAAFEAHIEIANRAGLPIVIHSRDSEKEVLRVLRAAAKNIRRCVMHCFSGDKETAEEALGMGCYLGFDGPITFKNAEKLRDVVRMCPIDRCLVETDCPYLSPVPHRGKRNEPAHVRLVAQAIARIKEIDLEEVCAVTTANAYALFGDRL